MFIQVINYFIGKSNSFIPKNSHFQNKLSMFFFKLHTYHQTVLQKIDKTTTKTSDRIF